VSDVTEDQLMRLAGLDPASGCSDGDDCVMCRSEEALSKMETARAENKRLREENERLRGMYDDACFEGDIHLRSSNKLRSRLRKVQRAARRASKGFSLKRLVRMEPKYEGCLCPTVAVVRPFWRVKRRVDGLEGFYDEIVDACPHCYRALIDGECRCGGGR